MNRVDQLMTWHFVHNLLRCSPVAASSSTTPLSWLPPTYSSIALRLATLDASLLFDPSSGSTGRDQLAGYRYVLRPPVLLRDNRRQTSQGSSASKPPLEGAALSAAVAAYGRIRPLQLLPHLPSLLMSQRREFSFDVEDMRSAVELAEEQGLPPEGTQQPWRLRAGLGVKVVSSKPKGGTKPGGAAAGVSAPKSKGAKAAAKPSKSKKKGKAKSSPSQDSDKDYGEDFYIQNLIMLSLKRGRSIFGKRRSTRLNIAGDDYDDGLSQLGECALFFRFSLYPIIEAFSSFSRR